MSGETQMINKKNKGKSPSKKPKNKRLKEISIDDISAQLLPAKDLIEANVVKYPLNYDNISAFLYSTFNNPKVLEVAASFTNDHTALNTMLLDVKEIIPERKLKNRIDRILNK